MRIDFGKVNRYDAARGFGFVSHTFARSLSNEVFFHIKSVKRTHLELAQALSIYNSYESPFFWYEFANSDKGQQVLKILNPLTVRQNYVENASVFTKIIKNNWIDIETPLSESIKKATFDFLLPDEVRQLTDIREVLEEEKRTKYKVLEEERNIKYEIQKAESVRLREIANQRVFQEKAEEDEFRQLVAEMLPLRFTTSNQVSKYIINNRLGGKYKHISGILQMERDGNMWAFDGGILPRIYARLCDELELGNQYSEAKPGEFESYNAAAKRQGEI